MRDQRILCVSSQLPWPLDRGGHIRSFHLMRSLAQEWLVSLVAGTRRTGDEQGCAAVERAGIDVRAARLPERTPLAELTRAGLATMKREPYVLFHRHNRRQMWGAIGYERRERGPIAAAYLDHLDSWLYAEAFKDVPRIVDLHNVYSTLVQRESTERRDRVARAWLQRDARALAAVEEKVMKTASLVLAVSELERDHFARLGPAPVALVENGVDAPAYADLPTGRAAAPPVILYLGTLSWSPNEEAAAFLATDVLPSIQRSFPDARLKLVGRNPTATVRKLAGRPGVEVIGEVADVRPSLADASVLAVPLEVGGGTRLKILEAFAAGLPVISSPIGSEGLAVRDREHLMVVDRKQFASGLETLLREDALRNALAERARALVNERYDWGIIGERLRAEVRRAIGLYPPTS